MIKAVLFDMDGVLIDTEHINTAAAVLSMREQGINLTSQDKKFITGRNPVDYSIDFAKKYSFDRGRMLARHAHHYDRLYYRAKRYRYSKDIVLKVRKCGLKTALVTSAEHDTVKNALKVLKLKASAFDEIVAFEECKKRKPDPQPYLLAAKLLKVKPSECVVIEDSIAGIESAKRAKMTCVAVTHTFPASRLKKADLIISAFNDRRIMELLSC